MKSLVFILSLCCLAITVAPGEQPALSENVASLVSGNNAAALKLFRELESDPGKNLFFSPYSISTAFGMVYAGARGETAAQLRSALAYPEEPGKLAPLFRELGRAVNAPGAENAFALSVANALWIQKTYPLNETFTKGVTQNYDASATLLDLEGDPEGSSRTINQWVEKETNDRIKDLITPEMLQDLPRLVLTNAIYFKGAWTNPFDSENTEDAEFFVGPGATRKVPMMFQSGRFGYAEESDMQILQMNYEGDEVAMMILLPRERFGLAALEKNLTAESLDAWTKRIDASRLRQVRARIPKLKLETDYDLVPALEALGATDPFEMSADLSGMPASGRSELYISTAVHKAFVAVDEEGTEAAAATGIVVSTKAKPAKPVEFTADHPYLFLIRHKPTGTILFLGRVADPSLK